MAPYTQDVSDHQDDITYLGVSKLGIPRKTEFILPLL